MIRQTGSLLLSEYIKLVEPTDKMPQELRPVLFGLFGEVGSVMAASKKYHREKEVYGGFHSAVVEEFGDVLWYLVAIGRRLQIDIDSIFMDVLKSGDYQASILVSDLSGWPLAIANRVFPQPSLDPALLKLGEAAASLLRIEEGNPEINDVMHVFVNCYIQALQASEISFGEAAHNNAAKTRGRFLDFDFSALPTFDDEFEIEEQLPRKFEVKFTQRKSGKCYMQLNNVVIGDPLTDNIGDPDGYRFHDIFHLAHAAILHWSPVFRALIKHKRKSSALIDETQDGGRAIVIEEGLTAWIFSQAKETGFFAGRKSVAFDLLKDIEKFVAGYEVEQCPLKLWERAILQGYEAFVKMKEHGGGILVGDRDLRSLTFRALDE